jgi:antiviral helicase SKI2
MDDEGVLDAILSPDAANIPILLDHLGLGGLPSQEDVHAAIEQKLLLPKDQLPAHWLPAYQMCVSSYPTCFIFRS